MMKRTAGLLFVATALFGASLFAPNVFADSYGNGGETPNDLTINKQVKNPITGIFVENLGSSDPTFSPGATITYKLYVKNGSGETMRAKVEDTLPSYLSFVSASVATTYDAASRKITMDIGDMVAGSSKDIEVTAKVADRSSFANDRTMFCTTNYAKVTAPSRPNGDDDTAESCITTGGTSSLPIAGVHDLMMLVPFLSLGGTGLLLLKKSKS